MSTPDGEQHLNPHRRVSVKDLARWVQTWLSCAVGSARPATAWHIGVMSWKCNITFMHHYCFPPIKLQRVLGEPGFAPSALIAE